MTRKAIERMIFRIMRGKVNKKGKFPPFFLDGCIQRANNSVFTLLPTEERAYVSPADNMVS
jgi:hypothetical protein